MCVHESVHLCVGIYVNMWCAVVFVRGVWLYIYKLEAVVAPGHAESVLGFGTGSKLQKTKGRTAQFKSVHTRVRINIDVWCVCVYIYICIRTRMCTYIHRYVVCVLYVYI